jgi:hypothetical protein
MYKPLFNKVLVEINQDNKKWGSADDSIAGESYREGVVLGLGTIFGTLEHPINNENAGRMILEELNPLIGREIMWNEGHEAGTTWEDDGKVYGLIYWWEILGVKS